MKYIIINVEIFTGKQTFTDKLKEDKFRPDRNFYIVTNSLHSLSHILYNNYWVLDKLYYDDLSCHPISILLSSFQCPFSSKFLTHNFFFISLLIIYLSGFFTKLVHILSLKYLFLGLLLNNNLSFGILFPRLFNFL